MESALPVIEVVTFRANKTCLDDPGLFKEVRDMVAATTSVVPVPELRSHFGSGLDKSRDSSGTRERRFE